MSHPASSESSWRALRDVVGAVMSAIRPLPAGTSESASEEERRKG
jgi:hypothetical protein